MVVLSFSWQDLEVSWCHDKLCFHYSIIVWRILEHYLDSVQHIHHTDDHFYTLRSLEHDWIVFEIICVSYHLHYFLIHRFNLDFDLEMHHIIWYYFKPDLNYISTLPIHLTCSYVIYIRWCTCYLWECFRIFTVMCYDFNLLSTVVHNDLRVIVICQIVDNLYDFNEVNFYFDLIDIWCFNFHLRVVNHCCY